VVKLQTGIRKTPTKAGGFLTLPPCEPCKEG
jgi:hypothetical protein